MAIGPGKETRIRRRVLGSPAILLAAFTSLACSDGPSVPSSGAHVTFRVVDETFRVGLLDEAQIEAARRAQAGGRATIPVGRIVAGTGVNMGWTWHLVEVEFAEAAVEVCDGRPSDVEREGVRFGGGTYCPWSAQVIAIREP